MIESLTPTVIVMIPEFTEDGVLPAGIHAATMDQFEERFAIFDQSDQRIRVFKKLEAMIDEAWKSGIVRRIYVAGSFVTDKPDPNDFDCILVLDSSIVGQKLRPFQYNLVSRRMARRVFGGDVAPALDGSQQLREYLDFFQTTRDGEPMGIVEIER